MSIVKIATFVDSFFAENAYVVTAEGHGGAWVVDPSFEPQCRAILAHVEREQLDVEAVVLTHGHVDHIAGVDVVLERWPSAGLYVPRGDAPMLADADANLSAPFGLPVRVRAKPSQLLDFGAVLRLGPTAWRVLDTSGHSPGGASYYCAEAGVVLAGDALFEGSIGRTDFPGADGHRLVRNIRENLLALPGATRVYSGHGPVTTIEKERRFNPWLAETS